MPRWVGVQPRRCARLSRTEKLCRLCVRKHTVLRGRATFGGGASCILFGNENPVLGYLSLVLFNVALGRQALLQLPRLLQKPLHERTLAGTARRAVHMLRCDPQ